MHKAGGIPALCITKAFAERFATEASKKLENVANFAPLDRARRSLFVLLKD